MLEKLKARLKEESEERKKLRKIERASYVKQKAKEDAARKIERRKEAAKRGKARATASTKPREPINLADIAKGIGEATETMADVFGGPSTSKKSTSTRQSGKKSTSKKSTSKKSTGKKSSGRKRSTGDDYGDFAVQMLR